MMIEYSEKALQDEQTIQTIISMADFQSCLKFNRMVTFFMLAFLGVSLHWFSKIVHSVVPNTLKLIFDIFGVSSHLIFIACCTYM